MRVNITDVKNFRRPILGSDPMLRLLIWEVEIFRFLDFSSHHSLALSIATINAISKEAKCKGLFQLLIILWRSPSVINTHDKSSQHVVCSKSIRFFRRARKFPQRTDGGRIAVASQAGNGRSSQRLAIRLWHFSHYNRKHNPYLSSNSELHRFQDEDKLAIETSKCRNRYHKIEYQHSITKNSEMVVAQHQLRSTRIHRHP